MLLDQLLDRLIRFFTSMRLTVVCLALALVLVFWGTLAQVELGLYRAQNEFFRSFFIYWGPKGASWSIPVFPGGYLVGGVLLINLIASQIKRFSFTASKIGLWMVHVGLILLLLGQLLTDLLSRESTLHLREGEAKNYSVDRARDRAGRNGCHGRRRRTKSLPSRRGFWRRSRASARAICPSRCA